MAFSAMDRNQNSLRRANQNSLQDRSTNDSPKTIGQLLNELEVPDKMLRGESFLAKQHQERKAKAQEKQRQTLALIDESLQKLDAQLRSGQSELLKQFLSTMAKFHRYSFSNQLLIQMQCPTATRVAGFNNWRKFGRHVKKGEKGIRIIAPMVRKFKSKELESQDTENVENRKKVYGFRVVSVFDISQTNGKPMPDIGQIGGDAGAFLSKLRVLIRDKGIDLSYENLAEAEGVSKGGAIVIDSRLDPANEFSVLVHELAHETMHRGDRRSETTKTQRETEAEAVAFVVSQAFGVETTARTTDYIHLYRGDSELLAESLELIRSTSIDIITSLSRDQNENHGRRNG